MTLRLFVAPILSLWIGLALLPRPVSAQSNGITREVYTGIAGDLPSLTNNANFPNSPFLAEVLANYMEVPAEFMDNYGTRLRALITAPTTGNYTFWIASDDNSVLYLSTDATPANKRQIAYVATWTASREWTKETNQVSTNIPLVAGQQYYIEALQAEGGGGDNLSVRWQLPGGTIEEPIPATRCAPVGVTAPIFTLQPTNVTVIEGNQINFAVSIINSFSATLQWQRAGTNLPGQTATNLLVGPVSLADSGSVFRCVAVNFAGTSFTTNALLRVVPDTTPPTISSVGNLGDNQIITVVFSEPVSAATATAMTNYTINNGVSVLNASFGPDNRTVVLTTTPLAFNTTYTLTVNNVRDLASTPNTIVPNTQRTFSLVSRPLNISFLNPRTETIGPSTRRGGLVISELLYHPTNRFDLRNVEFLEIHNANPWFEELGGYTIDGAVSYTFPSNFVLGAKSFVVIAAVPTDVQTVYGISGVLGPWIGSLQNSSGNLRLRNTRGAVLFEMEYNGDAPYPVAADGGGHSLVLARPSFGALDARAWAASDLIGGRPGTNEVIGSNPLATVMINEFLANSTPPALDYVELFNYSASSINVGGCVLTDDPTTNKFSIPPSTFIPAGGFLVFYETTLGFSLNSGGEDLFFKNPQATRVLDAVRFEAQENGVSTGRFPDGAPSFSRLQSLTPGTNNTRLRAPTVVINEVMYHPVSENSDDEFIELYNPTTNAVNVGKWRIKDAVKFTLPTGAIIPANGYLVLAAKVLRLRGNYPTLNAGNSLGDWEGTLKNGGERVALTMPEQVVSTNGLGVVSTNTIHIVLDEVSYRTGGRWGRWSAGDGSSLELRDPRSDHRLAPNWADSDESAKSGWVNVEATGPMVNGYENASQLHITLMGAGEALIDNVEIFAANYGTNIIGNGTFESGTANWVFQGNHNQTSWETSEGFSSSRSLHLRAVGRGDTGANRVRTQLPFTLAGGTTNVTLRAKVRWLKGNPNILLRLRGNHHEAPGFTLTASNLGTPGAANSTATTNVGPAITDVTHWPILPAANQQVLVTARVHDADGLSSLLLNYRIDPSTNFIGLAMTNNGAGLYSAVLPAQVSGVMAAFHIQAADKLSPTVATKFPNDAPVRECFVMWGDTVIPGSLGTYRFWMSQATIADWSTEEKMSNKAKDVTFAYGTNRIIYNAGAWFHGSPYHSPSYNSPIGNACDYDMNFPDDDRLLGENDINLFRPGNGGGDSSAQAEAHGYWFGGQFGAPFLFNRHVFVYANGLRRDQVFLDAQQPNSDYIDQWFPDDADGELHKIQLGFEFGDTAYGAGESGYTAVGADLNRYTTTGGAFHIPRYRQTWPRRASNPADLNNYTNIFALVNTAQTTAAIGSTAYTSTLTNVIDVAEWYQVHVTQHLYNNGDSFSYGGGQNAFAYKPEHDTWKLFLWDVDFAFGGSATDANLFSIGGAEHGPRNDHPPFLRIYWQTLIRAANTFMTAARSNPILDSRFNGLTAGGASVGSPQGIKDFIAARRAYILGVIAANNTSPFEVQNNSGLDFSTNNNLVTINGRAPFDVASIEVNGIAYAVTWTTLTNWTLRLALPSGTNALSVVGYDYSGTAVSNATDTIAVNVTAPAAPPQNHLVLNEIMFDPLVPDAEYVELFNTSATVSFDLSSWRLDGLDFIFPEGTIIVPRGYLLLAKNLAAFATAYGTNIVPGFVFNGNLQSGGETLALVKPGLTAATDVIIDQVRYEGVRPWPAAAQGTGSSVQLMDPSQDNSRVGNWWAVASAAVYSGGSSNPATLRDGWRFVSATGFTPGGLTNLQRLAVYLGEAGSAYLDDFALVPGTNAAVGTNYITNGDFESPLTNGTTLATNGTIIPTGWLFGTNYNTSLIVNDLVHSNTGALKVIGTSIGTVNPTNRMIFQYLTPAPLTNATHTLSFWYWATNSATNLYVRVINATRLTADPALGSGPTNINLFITPSNYVPPGLVSPGTNSLTPGTANTGTNVQPAFPTLWLNEVQADNVTGLQDSYGERDPWVEIYNAGTNVVSLNGLYLSFTYTNLTNWAFPAGQTINPGEFRIIYCDGQPAQTTNTELHTTFRLPVGAGSIALSRLVSGQPRVVDYLNYLAGLDHSYGSFPDGQPFHRQEFYFVTPAATNNGTLPPVVVFINEWMADNLGTLADPADSNFEDWIELYNPGSNSVSLGGYFLTDTLTNKFKFQIPPGYSIPPRGYLLVWADNETGQNNATNLDLHASFSLAKSGEAIGLFTPGGVSIDAVTFSPQGSDVSQGHFPDGTGPIYFLTNVTPRAANFIPQPNTAPTLASIPNQNIFERTLLSFPATATDPNSPVQQLTWTLDPGAPAFAAINPSNGLFTWVPPEQIVASNYLMTARVTDNGTPPLDAARTFTVSVLKTNSAPTVMIPGDALINEGASGSVEPRTNAAPSGHSGV